MARCNKGRVKRRVQGIKMSCFQQAGLLVCGVDRLAHTNQWQREMGKSIENGNKLKRQGEDVIKFAGGGGRRCRD